MERETLEAGAIIVWTRGYAAKNRLNVYEGIGMYIHPKIGDIGVWGYGEIGS